MRISVVIATKDRARYLERALASFGEQRGAPSFEVIVVDNGSSDDTKATVDAAAKAAKFPIRYVFEKEPNRGKARNRGIAITEGYLIVFCDDDIVAPPRFLASHETAHSTSGLVVSGPIINVGSYDERPKPSIAHYSGAFLCTCNVSIPKPLLDEAGDFDEQFDLYGWEDTELGVRLRDVGARRRFAWDAYIWHIKPPEEHTLEVETRKALEKARMARRFIEKSPSARARLATGAHPLNIFRGKYVLQDGVLAILAGLAIDEKIPPIFRTIARAQFIDGMYTKELVHALEE